MPNQVSYRAPKTTLCPNKLNSITVFGLTFVLSQNTRFDQKLEGFTTGAGASDTLSLVGLGSSSSHFVFTVLCSPFICHCDVDIVRLFSMNYIHLCIIKFIKLLFHQYFSRYGITLMPPSSKSNPMVHYQSITLHNKTYFSLIVLFSIGYKCNAHVEPPTPFPLWVCTN